MTDFVNPAGLQPIGENLYAETSSSGAPLQVLRIGWVRHHPSSGCWKPPTSMLPRSWLTSSRPSGSYEMNSKVLSTVDEVFPDSADRYECLLTLLFGIVMRSRFFRCRCCCSAVRYAQWSRRRMILTSRLGRGCGQCRADWVNFQSGLLLGRGLGNLVDPGDGLCQLGLELAHLSLQLGDIRVVLAL